MAGLLDDWLGPQSQIGGLLGGFNDQANAALSNPMFNLGLHMMLARPGKQDEAIAAGMKSAQNAMVMQRDAEASKALMSLFGGPNTVSGASQQSASGGLLADASKGSSSPSQAAIASPAGLLMTDQGHPLPPPRPSVGDNVAPLASTAPAFPAGPKAQSIAPPDQMAGAPPNPALGMPAHIKNALPALMASERTRPLALQLMQKYGDPDRPLEIGLKQAQLTNAQNEAKLFPGKEEGQRLGNVKTGMEISGDLPTDVQRNYKAYVDQERAAGREPRSLFDYQQAMRSQNNVVLTGEKAYDADIGKANAKRYVELQQQGQNATSKLGTLRVMESMVNRPEFYSGFGGDMAKTVNQALVSLGVKDANAASSAEAFGALSNKLVMDGLGGSLGQGISNADVSFLRNTVPHLANTPDGNRQLIGIARKVAEREQDIAKQARDYAKQNGGRLDSGFDEHLAQWSKENPMFPQEAKQGAQGGPVQTPAAGAVMDGYRFKGGNPADRSAWEKVR